MSPNKEHSVGVDFLPPEEAERRAREVAQRMLTTPKHRKDISRQSREGRNAKPLKKTNNQSSA